MGVAQNRSGLRKLSQEILHPLMAQGVLENSPTKKFRSGERPGRASDAIHVPGRAGADVGELAPAGGDERAGQEVPVGKGLAEVRRHGRRLARLRQKGDDGVGVLTRHIEPAIVAELHVEGVDHRRHVLRGGHHRGEAEGVAVAFGDGGGDEQAKGGGVDGIPTQK